MGAGGPTDITRLLSGRFEPPPRFTPDAAGWVPDGRCVAYRADGSLLLDMHYDRGVPHGPYRDYWPDGRAMTEGQYVAGVQDGEWRYFDGELGNPPYVIRFAAGRQIMSRDELFGRPRA